MIHQVFLPEITRERLTDVVALQVLLLTYAATRDTLNEASCTTYLDRCARFRGRGAQIAAWIWRAPSRYEPLEKFAQGPAAHKLGWCKRITREAFAFMQHPIGHIDPHIRRTASPWERAGAAFHRRFYVDLCSPAGLPGDIFCEPVTGSFGRQDLLAAFKEANHHLHICAVCDETGYHTMLDGHIYAELDHYLPESVYPHLACHPFNLIPICHYCNVMIKGKANPLQGLSRNRFSVEAIFLPYGESGLGARTYLHVRLGGALTEAEFGELKPREEITLRSRIEGFRRMYKIPDRWRQRVDEIGPQLLKRIREFLRGSPVTALNARSLLNELDDLLYSLHQAQGSEPFACAKMWWLAALINDEVEPATRRRQHPSGLTSPLLEEISAMLRLDRRVRGSRPRRPVHTSSAHLETARNLRSLLRRAR
jgi:5-methylcytosine-specific restriction endonuclease McrA